MLDILESWEPKIDWDRFKQGPVSDAVWDHFKQVVIWSHVYCHWGREVVAKRSSHAVRTIFPEKSAQDVRKRQAQRQLDIEQSGQRWHRAKRLARDEVAKLSYLETVAKGTPDTVDGKLYFALRTVLNDNPVACALESFDAEYELQDKAEARLSRVG